jgi:hypothetical protein
MVTYRVWGSAGGFGLVRLSWGWPGTRPTCRTAGSRLSRKVRWRPASGCSPRCIPMPRGEHVRQVIERFTQARGDVTGFVER